MKLPPQPWREARGVRAVVTALGPGQARFVGGAVRDALLGLDVSDIDMATVLEPADVVARLEAAKLRAVPTGIAHGTVTAVAHGQVIEVTTLRRDVATDGRHAEVAFIGDWRADAARRDFTLNALYADPESGAVEDYFGGLADLDARRVRFIGDPLTRIAEDHLRILRFFRFHARFGAGVPDAEGLAACAARANDLMALSRERVQGELFKLLCVADPVPALGTMLAHGILMPVLPEIGAARMPDLAALVALETAQRAPCVPVRRLAALLPPDPALLDDLGGRLRLSNADRKRLAATASRLDAPPAVAPLAYAHGPDTARDLLLLGGYGEQLDDLEGWTRPTFPISGRDILALGVGAGPEVARILQSAERDWIAAGFPPGRDAALALAKPYLPAPSSSSAS